MTPTSLVANPHPDLAAAAGALRSRGHTVQTLPTVHAAAAAARALIPAGASVFCASSETVAAARLEEILRREPTIRSVRQAFNELDYTRDRQRMRALACAPDVVIGSVQAVTLDGEILIASSSGSQLASYAYGAGRVLWLVGAQKIVPDAAAALARVQEHCLPLEDARARAAYGEGSAVNKLLTIFAEHEPGRTHVLLIEDEIGF